MSQAPDQDRDEPGVEKITVTPDPVPLRPPRTEIVIDVVETGGQRVTGLLRAPGGSPDRLRFTGAPGGTGWQAGHRFRPDDPPGLWQVEVTSGGLVTEQELQVLGVRPPGEVRFRGFDVQPREIAEGDAVRATGRLTIVVDGEPVPFGGQLVFIAHRPDDSDAWAYIGRTVTEWKSGEFSTEVFPDRSGDVRAVVTFLRRPEGAETAGTDEVHSESVHVEVAAFGGAVAVSRRSPVARTCSGVPCYRHVGTVRYRQDGSPTPSGWIQIHCNSGGWFPAKNPKGGLAVGPVTQGSFTVFTRRILNATAWKATYSAKDPRS
ncbi:hypothetical protein [Planobispora takensis]|uniref:Uncharacterized protein n=1 Tax=Planobispora takensis TaxID=1367882 RepID=A0A8J3T3P6_9ACTN|nr:hypothetical protein [Planobispora takensis]GII03678.1 hypothetical protein Pta02_56860 [Planobispora takensis]